MIDIQDATRLSEGFDTPSDAQWRDLAEKSLKGAPWEKVIGKTADGLKLEPLYRESTIATGADPFGVPGAAPFVRGAKARRDAALPWHIRQIFAHPDPHKTNEEILADLERGVSSLELVIDPDGAGGVAIRAGEDFDVALASVAVDLAPVSLDAGPYGLWAAEFLKARLKGLAAQGTAFNIDPIGALMRTGAMGAGDIANAAKFAASVRDPLPTATALRVDARPVHEAGGTEAQELAVALAAGVAYLRALTDAGLPIGEAGKTIAFTFALGPDVLIEAAKLRALRLAWARVMEAAGASDADRAAMTHAVTSRRMLTRRDPWSNILRGTASCFAAAVGGADAISVLPLTDALGLPTSFSRRVARNTQILLMEESNIGRVADPAGGSWFVEEMTRELADAAWAKFQAIEAQGGVVAAFTSGSLPKDIAVARAAKEKTIASRKDSVTGVTDFPQLNERMPEIEQADIAAIVARRPTSEAPALQKHVTAEALPTIRWATPFEKLRDKAEAAKPAPKVFFATLGKLADFSARSNYALNLFAAGGIAAHQPETVYENDAARCAAWAASNTPVAVLCGADKDYAASAEAAAKALKAAGCAHIVLAGKPADEAAMKAAGIDQFVFTGQNSLEALKTLHAALGIK